MMIPMLPSPVGLYGWRPLRALVWTKDGLQTDMPEGAFGYTGQAESVIGSQYGWYRGTGLLFRPEMSQRHFGAFFHYMGMR